LLEDPLRAWKKAAFTVVARRRSNQSEAAAGSVMATRALDPNWLGRTVRTESWRYTEWPDGTVELYDHRDDPHEYVNLASAPNSAPIAADLKRLLREGWKAALP
jgi:arylsulfatase A-like enzyme